MQYVKETRDGVVTGLLRQDGPLPDNPPYEYEEMTAKEYDELLRGMQAQTPVDTADEPETPPDAPSGSVLTQDQVDFLAGLMEGLGV